MAYRIPLNKIGLEGTEVELVDASLKTGYLASGGVFSKRCESLIEELIGGTCFLTTSCTSALEFSALLSGIGPGDEVIMPSYTFVSTANAFCLRGATPVFAEVRRETMNIDESQIEALITPRTRAIVAVHYAGLPCDMDAINAIAQKHGVLVIEDAAQAFLSTYKGRPCGTLSDMGCFSYHETKTFTSGEGGALIVNSADLVPQAEMARDFGTNRSQFMCGEADKYTWQTLGSSYSPSEAVSALLIGQIEARDIIISKRRKLCERYQDALSPLVAKGVAWGPHVPADCTVNYHLFYLLARERRERDALIAHFKTKGILATFHYVPLHSSPFSRSNGWERSLPVTDEVADRVVRLPMFNALTMVEQDEIIDTALEFYR